MSNIQKMLKKAQQMQQDMERAQGELSEAEIPFSGNGVEVIAKGDYSIKSISIEADLITADDKEMLEDCITVAVNGAMAKVRKETEDRMSGVTGGLNIPGLF